MELYREEKRRGRRGIEVTRRRKGRVKRGERNQTSNQIPKCKWILKIRFLKVKKLITNKKKQRLKT